MPPERRNESSPLLFENGNCLIVDRAKTFDSSCNASSVVRTPVISYCRTILSLFFVLLIVVAVDLYVKRGWNRGKKTRSSYKPLGPYELVECQEGETFFDHYTFYDGLDSLGSAGYNVYVGFDRAMSEGLANVKTDTSVDNHLGNNDTERESFVYIRSKATEDGPRESVRLEGKHRYDNGLFILDLRHMPAGCGVWPAFWLTDEDEWPDNGEIDIVEGVNRQIIAKTALHTSAECSMYAHVPPFVKTGTWDHATGIPNTWTGEPDYKTKVAADNCWFTAPHQWFNQGCVAVNAENGTLGAPLNAAGGGVYVLEWDPQAGYIKSWVFTPRSKMPVNLQDAIRAASKTDNEAQTMPDPTSWGLPYAYFAIGEGTGCSADHFKNMRIVINIAFCGAVSGNRFFGDCPVEAKEFRSGNDPLWSCNSYIKSDPKELEEAYWKIRGVYVYKRALRKPDPVK